MCIISKKVGPFAYYLVIHRNISLLSCLCQFYIWDNYSKPTWGLARFHFAYPWFKTLHFAHLNFNPLPTFGFSVRKQLLQPKHNITGIKKLGFEFFWKSLIAVAEGIRMFKQLSSVCSFNGMSADCLILSQNGCLVK